MEGPSINDQDLMGITPRMVYTLFESVAEADEKLEFTVKVSVLEIYLEKIRDLINTDCDNLQVRENKEKGVWVDGATEIYVTAPEDIFEVLEVVSTLLYPSK